MRAYSAIDCGHIHATLSVLAHSLDGMRNIDRIDPALDQLRAVWLANPDLRLGQLVLNAADAASAGGVTPCPGLFYMEDAALLSGLTEA